MNCAKTRKAYKYFAQDCNFAIKAAVNTKAKEIKNKIRDTTSFISGPEFNWLTELSFDSRMKEAEKNLATKTGVKYALFLWDENREK